MNIYAPIIRGNAGGDLYFEILRHALSHNSNTLVLKYFPHLFELFPAGMRLVPHSHNQYDLIHSQAEFGHLFAHEHTPMVVTLHHNVFDPPYVQYITTGQRLYHHLILKSNLRKTLSKATSIIAVSNYTKQSILQSIELDSRKIEVIHNGIDTNQFTPINRMSTAKSMPIRLLFVGNNTRRKGFDLLVPLMKKLGNEYILYYTSGLRHQKVNLSPSINMVALGTLSQAELITQYQACDIFLSPTRLEGFGYNIVEAMACGKTVVATDCSSIPELITHGHDGFLCPLDDIDAFATMIIKIASDADLREKIGLQARIKVMQSFDLSSMTDKYTALYQSVLTR